MTLKRVLTAAGLAIFSMCGTGLAQESPTILSGVSPIPSDAQARFCYYAGLAYSPNSYLAIIVPLRTTGTVSVAETSGGVSAKAETTPGQRVLFQCVTGAAAARKECLTASCKPNETMVWAVRQDVAVSPR